MILFEKDIEKLRQIVDSHSKTFILCDGNTINYCLPLFFEKTRISDFVLIEIPSGEVNKNINTVQEIWKQLIENHADRKSILINIGGGYVSDIGGFAASCFKRGIDFINVPTTLLAMVDASIGGKNGIDFQDIKNQIGTFAQPLAVLVISDFLQTLPKREFLSGLGELLKYGFICDASFFEAKLPLETNFVKKAIEAKDAITNEDPTEQGIRKCLNFGHTVGHAIESYFVGTNTQLLHGEAVALGILPALYLSEIYCDLDKKWTLLYKDKFASLFDSIKISDLDCNSLLDLMRHDKKNLGSEIRFVLISEPGKPVIDVAVKQDDIICSINYLIDYLNDEDYFNK